MPAMARARVWLTAVLLCACSFQGEAHRSAYVEVDGIRLHTLEWGGRGPAVVMIHGIGDSPYVFSDLAVGLAPRFRVVAYARRGHGQSDAPAGPYDLDTLVTDLRGVMDALGIERASLVGWSLGGNEITAFAARYPERVDKLVYLESGYDWSDPVFLPAFREALAAIAPAPADLASFDAYRAWFQRAWLGPAEWTPGLEAYLRDTVSIGSDGRVAPKPSDAVAAAILDGVAVSPRDYAKVRAPVLAFYSEVFFPRGNPKTDAFEAEVMVPFRKASSSRLKSEVASAHLMESFGRTHMSIGVVNAQGLAAFIGQFLAPQ
jgi:pimeloyl-ACP methyl ester carboxylesterase